MITLSVNGRDHSVDADPATPLLYVLRDDLGLNAAKFGCGLGQCGSCMVLVDGAPMAACSTFAFEVAGRAVVTIEGMASADGTLDPVQRAFVEERGFQCGYCTAGIILTVRALLDRDPDPDEAVIRSWLGANVCRCTGYSAIISAVRAAARLRREEGA